MTFEVETEYEGACDFAGHSATRLRIVKGQHIRGFYTAMWADHDSQVLDHSGGELIVSGVHRGGHMDLHAMRPARNSK